MWSFTTWNDKRIGRGLEWKSFIGPYIVPGGKRAYGFDQIDIHLPLKSFQDVVIVVE